MTETHENNQASSPSVDPDIESMPLKEQTPSSEHFSGKTSKRKVSTKSSSSSRTSSGSKRSTKGKKTKKQQQEDDHGAMIKYGSLGMLVAQMVGLVLLMRYSRTNGVGLDENGAKKDLYLSSTAVFMMEIAKFCICLVVVFFQSGSTLSGLGSELYHHVWMSPVEVLKLCVPSFLYTVQNNLLYLALSNLDAATYQVCYQLKILTTALFSAILLKRKFSRQKWLALILLTIGVAIVQISGSGDAHHHAASKADSAHRLIGLIAVLCAACTSGFSGVYFERILKGSTTSLWLRNIQMGLPSILIAYTTVYVKDAAMVASKGFFVGYGPLVWTVIIVQAAGGLIVAVVVKYADNVLKVFASSFSIIISCVISAFLFEFRPNSMFCLGTLCVVSSTVMYSKPSGGSALTRPRRKKKAVLPK